MLTGTYVRKCNAPPGGRRLGFRAPTIHCFASYDTVVSGAVGVAAAAAAEVAAAAGADGAIGGGRTNSVVNGFLG